MLYFALAASRKGLPPEVRTEFVKMMSQSQKKSRHNAWEAKHSDVILHEKIGSGKFGEVWKGRRRC